MKAEVRVCFYDSTKLQGWRKWVVRILSGSYHSHVHIELRSHDSKLVLLTMDGLQPRVIKLGLNRKFVGVDPYGEFSFGEVELDYEQDNLFISEYPATYHWTLIWYQMKRWFNCEDKKNIPPTCATFVSDFLEQYEIYIPRFFSPKQLWSYLHDGLNDRR